MAQVAVSFDLENLALRPEKDALLMEMIHKVNDKPYIERSSF
jgi:hypothetical protein